jgi:tripartite-type tricarboxylate transporter receptor subunit TctC
VGYEPGGGFDAYARLLADHLPRALGAANGVVSYMPGAATLNAANYINDVASAEGTEIGIPNSGLPINGFVLNANGALDVTKLNWIGRLDAIDVVCVAWHSIPVKNFSDVKSRGLVLGGTSPTGTSVMTPVALNKLAGAKFRMVLGYKGTTEQYLAMERGEIEGMGNAIWSQLKRSNPKWIDERRITPIYQEGHAPSADLPDVPTVIELAENEDDKRMLRLLASSSVIGRSFYVGSRVPRDRVAILREALRRTARDPAFLEAAEKLAIPINPMDGEALQAMISDFASYPKELLDRTRAAVAP